jgi:hypothetical protein
MILGHPLVTGTGSLMPRGTLIAVAPTADGIIVAADTRSTIADTYCDNNHKLVEVPTDKPTIIAVAGIGIVYQRPPPGTIDICAWIKNAPRVMDVESFVQSQVARSETLSTQGIQDLGRASLVEMQKLMAFSHDAPDAYSGDNFYTIIVATYDSSSQRSAIGVVGTRFNPANRRPEVTDFRFWEFYPDSNAEVFHFGLFDYVSKHVIQERPEMVAEYRRLIPKGAKVRDISALSAGGALANLILAASRTTALVPAPAGIGGPTDILLLGNERRPKKLRWKL